MLLRARAVLAEVRRAHALCDHRRELPAFGRGPAVRMDAMIRIAISTEAFDAIERIA
jgi:hypothetical protein